MELYDENLEEKKSKIPMIIGISIGILLVMTILIVYGIIYLKNSIKVIQIDGKRNYAIENILYIESTKDGLELYLPILKMSKYLGYEGFKGDYKNKSEDKTKCYVTSKNEIAMFTQNSDMLIKINRNSEYEYIQIDKPVFEKDGELYTTIDGIQKTFNVKLSHDQKFKNINIFSMEYLTKYYAKSLKLSKYSSNFNDQKAIFQNMMIIQENVKFGVVNTKKEFVLEAKYESISYLPATTDFLVKSNGKYGIVTKDATFKIRNVYDSITIMDNEHGLYLVKQDKVYGVLNTSGDVILAPEYKQIGINIEKYAQNGVENKYVFMDEIIPVKNNEDEWALFNIKGEKKTEFKYSGIGCSSTSVSNSYPVVIIPSYKAIVVSKDKHYNFVTTSGEELISGFILDSVYLKNNITTGQNEFFMTYNSDKVMNVESWMQNIGK